MNEPTSSFADELKDKSMVKLIENLTAENAELRANLDIDGDEVKRVLSIE